MKNKITFNYSDREKYSMIQINEFEEFSIKNIIKSIRKNILNFMMINYIRKTIKKNITQQMQKNSPYLKLD